ncbi:MAG TPA: PDZ domain-containing protein, partial [Gemmatimonadales bacterium]
MHRLLSFILLGAVVPVTPRVTRAPAPAPAPLGYFRFPAIHGDTVVFTAEGDLWAVRTAGGAAWRLTTAAGEETGAAISPDGKTVAFVASYEGPSEVYTMAISGGLPVRRTWDGGGATVTGWTPDGKVLYATRARSTLPNTQLFTIDPASGARAPVPLSQASDGSFDPQSGTLYFTRTAFQGSHTKRYQGGTAQHIWKFPRGAAEAAPLTADFPGTSKTPMWWQGRIYFASDRDGSMNLWSMDPEGKDLKQLTRHQGWDVQSPALADGKIVYQLGADLRLFDIASGQDRALAISLASDFDQLRVKWIAKPMEYLTAAHLSPTGDRVVLTARGQVFVAPAGQGRLVEASRHPGVRYRSARFTPDGKRLTVLSDETGETEWWTFAANGVGAPEQLTTDAHVLRWDGATSPDGKWLAYTDKNQVLWLLDLTTKKTTEIERSPEGDYGDLTWSPDSKWLAYARPTATFTQVVLYSVTAAKSTAVTSSRVDSYSPAWSADGKWLYFLSDRSFRSLVQSPWGARQPEPFFDRQTRIYLLPLVKGLRSPFQPKDELPAPAADTGKHDVVVDFDGIVDREMVVPVPAGNYGSLAVNGSKLFFLSQETTAEANDDLMTVEITNQSPAAKTLVGSVNAFELSADGKKILVRKGDELNVFDASAAAPATLDTKTRVDLSSWSFPLDPREEFRQMFREAWRLERDYFYDRHMNGVDWPAMLAKYGPLADRVTSRGELSDLLAQMVSELSALHIFVYGGDFRRGADQIAPASLGAVLTRDDAAGGYRISHIYRPDPDYPDTRSPLAQPGLGIADGDVIQMVNGVATLSVPDLAVPLENQTGKQVLLRVKPSGAAPARDVVVTP